MNDQNSKRYDLEDRTLEFGKKVIRLVKKLYKDPVNFNLLDQLVRSGTSVGANYREANETETKKDFQYRMRVCRKEAKETEYWLLLLQEANPDSQGDIEVLLQEVRELIKICAAIIEKTK